MNDSRRVGIFGGTFDPPHIAHLLCATAALSSAHLDEVILVVAGDPYQKQPVASAEDRYAMTCLAAQSSPDLVVSRMEIDRSGPSYTIDTVEELTLCKPEISPFLIGGSDAISKIRTWHRWEDLLKKAGFVIIPRDTLSMQETLAALGDVPEIIVLSDLPRLDISSTDIRARIAENLPVGHLMPSKVIEYIKEHNLYVD